MYTTEITIDVKAGGDSAQIATSTASAQGPVVAQPTGHPIGEPVPCTVLSETLCFIRKGANPTALSNGTDQAIPANTLIRFGLMAGERIAVIVATGTGNVYFTPNA